MPADVVGAPGRGRPRGRLLEARREHARRLPAARDVDRGARRGRRSAPLQRRRATRRSPTARTCSPGREAWERAPRRGSPCPARPRLLRRGDEGEAVERLTRRLAYVRRRGTGEHVPEERERALRRGRRRRGAGVPARPPPRRRRRGRVADRARPQPRRAPGEGAPRGARDRAARRRRPKAEPARLPALVERLARRDAETDEAWTALTTHGRGRVRLLARVRERQARPGGAGSPEGIDELASILLRIEAKLGRLLEAEAARAVGARAGGRRRRPRRRPPRARPRRSPRPRSSRSPSGPPRARRLAARATAAPSVPPPAAGP